jgi:hypothetical protein
MRNVLSIAVVVVIFLCGLPAQAQFDSAQISGVVLDSAGAVIPGVSVTVTNEGTRQELHAISNEQGVYVFPSLPIATYTVAAELPGFKKYVKRGVELSAAVNIRVDLGLQVGELTQTIEVQATTNEVVAETAVIGRSVGVREISEIPLAGRNVALVAQFRAGAMGGAISTNPNSGAATFSNGGLSINGARGDEYVTTVDGGLSLRIRSQTGFTMGAQNIDTVQEVQVLTSNYQAEMGRASGGLVRVVTKSGTREFHGTLFETHQNSALNANTWSRNSSPDPRLSTKPAAERYNSFGFALGGPIFIPKKFNADRSKLFFYVGVEWGRDRSEALTTATVPSLAMRNGDFSELLNAANPYFNRVRTINDPLTGRPFTNNVIPANRISANGRALLNLYPLPTPGFQQGTNNWQQSFPTWDNQRKDSEKIDYVINDRHRLAFRYTGVKHIWNQTFGLNSYDVAWVYPSRTTALTLTSNFSPTFLNEFTLATGATLGNDRIPTRYCPASKCMNRSTGYAVRSQTGLTYPFLFPGTKLDPEKISNVAVQGLTAIATSQYPGASGDFVGTLTDNMTKITGSHTFKWGFTVERSGMKDQTQFTTAPLPGTPNQNGAFRFMDTGRADGTGLSIANAALGLFNDYSEFNTKPITHYVATAWDTFFQDSWKATRKLTVEAGLRYSLWPAWGSAHDALAEFHSGFYDASRAPVLDRTLGFIVSGDRFNGIVLPGCEPTAAALERFPFLSSPQYKAMYHCLPNGFWETPKNGFQPRLGFAYSLNSKTAVRSGIGMFLNRVQVNNSNPLGGNPPLMEMQTVLNGNADNPGGGARRDYVLNISMRDPNMKTPTAWAWNATVERELPFASKVSIGYVARRGIFLERARNINQLLPGTVQANPGVSQDYLRPYKGYSTITLNENTAVSKYNSLQVQFDRRARGLGFNVAYTLSRNRDNASAKADLFPNSYDGAGFYGVSDLDRTHVLVANYYYSFPRLSSAPAAARWILAGWGISGTTQMQSGAPFEVTTTEDIAGVGPGSGNQYYTVVGNPKAVPRTDFTTSAVWFNKDAFVRPAAGTFAPYMRNVLRQPGFWDANVSITRNFAITEGQRFEFRWEAFNVLNHARLGAANSTPTSGSFGLITSKTGNRFMQVNLKYVF